MFSILISIFDTNTFLCFWSLIMLYSYKVSLNSYAEDACLFVMQCILFYLYYDLVYIPVLGYKAVGCNLQFLTVSKYAYVLSKEWKTFLVIW